MLLKEIIKDTAIFLGKDNVVEYLTNNTTADDETLSTVNTLVMCANLVINELSCTYIEMKKTETVAVTDGKVRYTALSESPLRIIEITDLNDKKINFTVKAEYIEVDAVSAKITYKYSPTNYGLTDTIGYTEKDVSSRVLAYGVCAEYSLTAKAFNEAITWRARFTDSIATLCMPKSKEIKERRFV